MLPNVQRDLVTRLGLWGCGGAAPPTLIEIQFTNYCQFNCSFCIAEPARQLTTQPNYRELSVHELLELSRAGAELGVRWWGILGGEPSSSLDRLLPFLSSIVLNGMNGFFVTNGWGLTKKVMAYLGELRWHNVVFSINSHSPKIHDRLVGCKHAWEHTIGLLKYLHKVKKHNRWELPTIAVNTIIHRHNYNCLDALFTAFKSLGIHSVQFLDMAGTRPGAIALALEPSMHAEFLESIERALVLARDYGIQSNLQDYRDSRLVCGPLKTDYAAEDAARYDETFASLFCFDPWRMMKISADGTISCCRSQVLASGKFTKREDLATHWYRGAFTKLRQQLLLDQKSKVCAECCVPLHLENKLLRQKLMLVAPLTLSKKELCDQVQNYPRQVFW